MRKPRAVRLLALALAACLMGLVALAGPVAALAAARPLQQGDRGDDVRELQANLGRVGYSTGAVTGYFGPATLKALKSFQQDHGLKADGIAGPATLSALAKAVAAKGASQPSSPQGGSSDQRTATTYTVRSGDALSLIAERFGVSLRALMEANRLRSADHIVIGQKLTIPGVSAAGKPSPPAPEPAAAPPEAADAEPAKPVVYQASRRLALTFDDGPDAQTTPKVLEVLARHKAVATFFAVGEKVEKNRDLVRRLAAAGNSVENHGYQHVDLTRLSVAAVRQDIDRGAEAIKAATGRQPRFFRPPLGAFNQAVADAASRSDQRLVMWSNVGQTSLPPDQLRQRLLDAAFDGAVLLLHDTDPSAAEVLDAVMTRLEEEGYRFVTVPQLFGDQ